MMNDMKPGSVAGYIKSGYALVQRNYNLIKHEMGWEVVNAIYQVVNALTIGFIGVSGPQEGLNERVLFLVSGALLWGFLSILFHEVAESVAWERWEGTIEYSFMAPQPRGVYMFGVCMWAIAYGLVRVVICLTAVTLAFNISLAEANLGGALLTLAASSLAFIGMGLAAAVLPLISPEKGFTGYPHLPSRGAAGVRSILRCRGSSRMGQAVVVHIPRDIHIAGGESRTT